MQYDQITVTPEIARAWLASTPPHQRRVSGGHVAALAEQLRAGTFLPNPQPFVIDRNGHLIDGQHRCHAVIASDVPMEGFVARDADPELFAVLDLQQRRTAAQFAGVGGALLTQAAQLVGVYRETEGTMRNAGALCKRYGIADTLELVETTPALSVHAEVVRLIVRTTRIHGATLLAVAALSQETTYQDKLADWHTGLLTGADLSQGDPRLVLRNRWGGGRYTVLNRAGAQQERWAITVKAWNAFCESRSITTLRWQDRERMPLLGE